MKKEKKGMKLLFLLLILEPNRLKIPCDCWCFFWLLSSSSSIFFDILYGFVLKPWWNWMSYVIVLGLVCCLSSDNLLSPNQTCTPYQIKPSSFLVFLHNKDQNLITAFYKCILLHFDIEVFLSWYLFIQFSVGRFLGSQFSVPMHTAYQ